MCHVLDLDSQVSIRKGSSMMDKTPHSQHKAHCGIGKGQVLKTRSILMINADSMQASHNGRHDGR